MVSMGFLGDIKKGLLHMRNSPLSGVWSLESEVGSLRTGSAWLGGSF